MQTLSIFLIPALMLVPLGLFHVWSRKKTPLYPLTADLSKVLIEERLEVHDDCVIYFKNLSRFAKRLYKQLNPNLQSHQAIKATIYLNGSTFIVVPYEKNADSRVYAEPFYIQFNENPILEYKLGGIKKLELLSLESCGDLIAIKLKDPEQSKPLNMTIHNLDLAPRKQR